jgi:hypothetical protein
MDRVARDLQADDVMMSKRNLLFLVKNVGNISSYVDVLDLCDKGVLNKYFSVYGCIPSSHSTNYIPIRQVKFN